jgi:hypothetical protein
MFRADASDVPDGSCGVIVILRIVELPPPGDLEQRGVPYACGEYALEMSEAGSVWVDDRSVCRESLFACGRVRSLFGDDVRPFEQDASPFERDASPFERAVPS